MSRIKSLGNPFSTVILGARKKKINGVSQLRLKTMKSLKQEKVR